MSKIATLSFLREQTQPKFFANSNVYFSVHTDESFSHVVETAGSYLGSYERWRDINFV